MLPILQKIKASPQLTEFKQRCPTIHTTVIMLAIVTVWRGIWGLFDLLIFPGQPLLSYLFSLILGVVILYLDGFSIDNLKR